MKNYKNNNIIRKNIDDQQLIIWFITFIYYTFNQKNKEKQKLYIILYNKKIRDSINCLHKKYKIISINIFIYKINKCKYYKLLSLSQ